MAEFFIPIPQEVEEGEYGLKLYNKNASEAENRENYLVAAINGIVSIDAVYYQNGLPFPDKNYSASRKRGF
ncbi:hypothetical protein AB6G04_01720 [Proteus mirabilis]|uniref:hypothetical protein n=1 Tax=Proteus mirabilis TaxID=584 RepID=UPI0034DCF937